MVNFYCIADTHFDHRKIILYENRPSNFSEIIINNWNSIVNPNDIVYVLGDFCFSGKDRHKYYCDTLNGKKILVRGNHDANGDSYYYDVGFNFVCDSFTVRKYGKRIQRPYRSYCHGCAFQSETPERSLHDADHKKRTNLRDIRLLSEIPGAAS